MAAGMITSASMLYPDAGQIASVALWPDSNPDAFQNELEEKVREVDSGEGVFILADIMGGTPCNRAAYSLRENVRLLSGMNLPMLLALLIARDGDDDLDAIAEDVLAQTQEGIVDVGALLKKRGL